MIGKREALNIPLFGKLCDPQWNILVGRDTRDSSEVRDKVIKDIEERQTAAEKGLTTPVFIFPEGATTNGTSVLTLKRGAFASLKAVRPSYAKITSYFGVTACHGDATSLFAYCFICILAGPWTYVRYDMPVFEPNEFFWKNHWDGKEEKWVAFARAVQHIIAENGGMAVSNNRLEDKVQYKMLVRGSAKSSKQ